MKQNGSCYSYFRDPDACESQCITAGLKSNEVRAVLDELISCAQYCAGPQTTMGSSTIDHATTTTINNNLDEHFDCMSDCTLPIRAQVEWLQETS
jgi:hypothetical protein